MFDASADFTSNSHAAPSCSAVWMCGMFIWALTRSLCETIAQHLIDVLLVMADNTPSLLSQPVGSLSPRCSLEPATQPDTKSAGDFCVFSGIQTQHVLT